MHARGRPMLALVAGAACISFAPILVRVLVDGGLGPTAAGFWRCLFGTVALAALTLARGRSLRLAGRPRFWAVVAGLTFFADLWIWHRAIRDAGAGLATILGNMQVFLTALLSVWLFRERIGGRFVAAAVAASVGVTLLVGVGSEVAFDATYLRGVLFGLLTAVAYASFLLAMRLAGEASDGRSTLAVMTWMSGAASVPLGVAAALESDRAMPSGATAWAAALGLALIAQSLGWWAISRSLPRVPGAVAGLVLLLQPVLAAVWGFLWFDERLTALQAVGAAVTLAGVYFGSRRAPTPART